MRRVRYLLTRRGRFFKFTPAPVAPPPPPDWVSRHTARSAAIRRVQSAALASPRRAHLYSPPWPAITPPAVVYVPALTGQSRPALSGAPRRGRIFTAPTSIPAPLAGVGRTRRPPVAPRRTGQFFEPPWPPTSAPATPDWIAPPIWRNPPRPAGTRRGQFIEPAWTPVAPVLPPDWVAPPLGHNPSRPATHRRGRFLTPPPATAFPPAGICAARQARPARTPPRRNRRHFFELPPAAPAVQTPPPIAFIACPHRQRGTIGRRGRYLQPPWPAEAPPPTPADITGTQTQSTSHDGSATSTTANARLSNRSEHQPQELTTTGGAS
jgi:hypothetical protein